MNEGLRRELGFLDVFSIATGAMISSGLFILPALAYVHCGKSASGLVLAYALAGVFVIPATLSKAELSTAMPKAGGAYFFIDRSLGPPMGTIGGLSSWFSLSLKSAFALVGLGLFAGLLVPGLSYTQVKAIASLFLLVFVLLNLCGAKLAGRAQVGLVLTLLAILGFYIIRAFPRVQTAQFTPILPPNTRMLFATAGLVFISYGGLTKIASVAEEVRDPAKTLPRAMLASWLATGFLYICVVFVTVGVLSPEAMGATHTPVSLGAKAVAGTPGLVLLSIAGIIAIVTTANAGILSASRSPMAMARDDLLPTFMGRINPRFGTPHYAIIATALFMFTVIVFLDLKHLVEVASALKILLFVLVNLSVIVMRESRMPNYRPEFRAPFYPWLQIAGIVGPLFLLVEFGLLPLLASILFLLGGFVWYVAYARPRTSRESGILYVVQRLISRHLSKGVLRKELRDIILQRDEIVADRFDRLVQDAPILDFQSAITVDQLFKDTSEVLSTRIGIDAKTIFNLMWERERESSTAIAPGLAIPHIIIPGEKKFDLLLARCRDGIVFDAENAPVNAVFVLIGTRDERNFHLKTLAAIAQIAQHRAFDANWQSAANAENLRDLLLLAERKRERPPAKNDDKEQAGA